MSPIATESPAGPAVPRPTWSARLAVDPVRPDSGVVLVNPSNRESVRSLFVYFESKGIGHKPPIGLLSIATVLRDSGYSGVTILDAAPDDLTPEQAAEQVLAHSPRVVGFSAMTDMWYSVWRSIQIIKQARPETIVVVGGPHALVYPALSLSASQADIVVAGDGEEAMQQVLSALIAGRAPEGIDGVYHRGDDGSLVTPRRPVAHVSDLDALPVPDRRLVALDRYGALLGNDVATTMITSRGCPYRCVFCKLSAQRVVARSAENVVREFAEAYDLGFRAMEVYDDTFSFSRERVLDICRLLGQRGIEMEWAVRSRVNCVDAECLRAMRAAGCNRIHFGIESGNRRVLRASKKGITLEQAREAVHLAKQVGMTVLTYFMVGFLDETARHFADTRRFAMSLPTDYVSFAVLIPYPGTEIYTQALERGVIPVDHWRQFVANPTASYRIPHLIEQHMTRPDLLRAVGRANFCFYWRPTRVLTELAACRSWKTFAHRASMGVNLLVNRLRRS